MVAGKHSRNHHKGALPHMGERRMKSEDSHTFLPKGIANTDGIFCRFFICNYPTFSKKQCASSQLQSVSFTAL